ncbi:hypothetical protein [Segetibacter koreensis]|uniref:hypothetical protein n=1 Tax=Segetibacter koreensis TaxID=398037 RepID=UPI00037C7F2F|nr:hypothetical protein [Segetibacter koreensis]
MVILFKDRSPATIFWLIVLSIVVHSHFFVDTPIVYAKNDDGLLSTFLNNYVVQLAPSILVFIYHAFIILPALRLNHLFTDHRMFSKVNYLPAMVYILLSGVFKEWSAVTPALIINPILIWFFAKTVRLYNSPNPKTLLFDIGLLTGISILLYHPSALLIPVAFFAVMVLRPFIIAEFVVLLMGVVFPFYLLVSYLYLTDNLLSIKKYIPLWQFNLPDIQNKIMFFITVGLIIIILLIGLFYWQQEKRRLLIQVRKNWVVLLAMLFVLLPIPFINKNAGIESLILCIVPASPLIAKGFLTPKRNTIPALLFWGLICLAIVKNWQLIK